MGHLAKLELERELAAESRLARVHAVPGIPWKANPTVGSAP